ncbi:MAG: LysE family transporter [Casimicrobiaceae bacterium]
MIGILDLPLFIVAGLVLNVTPRPDMASIASRSATGGFRDGAAAVFGITAGCCVHTLAAAASLSAILATSAAAFRVVKWCGALFNINGLFVNLSAAWIASRTARRLRDRTEGLRFLRRVTGGLCVLLAARLAVQSRN